MKIFIVGGAVRDEAMGRIPKDVDYVVVGASHAEMISLGFSKVGADFPVYLHPKTGDEYALARTERKTGNGYLGFAVDSSPAITLEDDLSRRDLTINAMARDVDSSEIVDPFNGLADLSSKVLRHVSAAFSEDPLRVIRLARFFSRYTDFTIAPETLEVAKGIVERGELNHLPAERFWAELVKVFEHGRPDRFFETLHAVNADLHVKFFAELFGPLTKGRVDRIMNTAQVVTGLQAELRSVVFTALTALPTAGSMLDNRTRELHKNVQFLRSLGAQRITEDNLYELLKLTKAFSDGPQVSDLRVAILSAAIMGERFVLKPQELDLIVNAARKVTSALYMDQVGPGKLLGAMIEKGRKQVIAEALNLRDD